MRGGVGGEGGVRVGGLLTTSNVETPSSLALLYTPAAFRTSAAIGTVEFTGLLMMLITAWIPHHSVAAASHPLLEHALQSGSHCCPAEHG